MLRREGPLGSLPPAGRKAGKKGAGKKGTLIFYDFGVEFMGFTLKMSVPFGRLRRPRHAGPAGVVGDQQAVQGVIGVCEGETERTGVLTIPATQGLQTP